MKNVGVRLAIFLGSSAIALLVAVLSLRKFTMTFWGFIIAVVVFSVLQSIFSPLLAKLAEKYAASLTSLVGLVSAFLALLVSQAVIPGVHIRGGGTWVLASLLLWIIPGIATLILGQVFKTSGADD